MLLKKTGHFLKRLTSTSTMKWIVPDGTSVFYYASDPGMNSGVTIFGNRYAVYEDLYTFNRCLAYWIDWLEVLSERGKNCQS